MITMDSAVDAVFCRCVEGKIGRGLDKYPDMGWLSRAVSLECSGVCHADGHQYYSWRGIVWPAHYGRFHFTGVLTITDGEGNAMENLEYNRTLEIW